MSKTPGRFACAAVAMTLLAAPFVNATAGSAQSADIAVFHFDPLQGPPSTVIQIEGKCLYEGTTPPDQVIVHFAPKPPNSQPEVFVRLTAGADGTISGTLTIPAETPTGSYTLSGTCFLTDFTFGPANVFTVEVTPAAERPADDTAPATPITRNPTFTG